jgi:hypothetical protein
VGRHAAAVSAPAHESARPTLVGSAPSAGRRLLSVLAVVAVTGIVAVTVVDPYSGATASPYFQVAPRHDEAAVGASSQVQTLTVATGGESRFARDGYDAEAAPPPPPPPPDDEDGAFAPPAVTPDPGSAKAIAQGMVSARGWGDEQFSCLVSLWNKESGWRVNAMNPSSGAYGIPQSYPGNKMASVGADWKTNPATQITWGLNYISARYGSPCGAWSHSEAVGSY